MHIIKHNVQLSPLFQHYHQLRPSLEGRQTDIYGCTKGVEIVILFSLWVSFNTGHSTECEELHNRYY